MIQNINININTYARKALSVSFSMLLIMSLLLGAISTPANAQTTAEPGECTAVDDFLMFLTLGLVNVESCSREAYVDAAINDMQNLDANQTKVDIYTAASNQKAGQKTFLAPFGNSLQDSETVAWSKAEVAIARTYENGGTKAEAKANARQAIEDYYAVRQKNLIEQWNSSVTAHKTLRNQAEMETGINDGFVGFYSTKVVGGGSVKNIQYGQTSQVTLVNGNTTSAKSIHVDMESVGGFSSDGNVNFGDSSVKITADSDGFRIQSFRVNPPSTSYDELRWAYLSNYSNADSDIETKTTNLKNEADTFVESTWSDYDSGDIEASDVISRNTAMFEYGVNGTNSDDINRVIASLALAGYDTANINNSGTMTIAYNSNTWDGIVMARNVPNSTWEVGKTYNTSNFSGPVFIATTDGQKIDLPSENAKFTIVEMTNKNGESINSIGTTTYNYKTANTTELNNKIDSLLDLRQQIEERESSVGGGGGISDGSGILPDWLTNTYFNIPLYVYIGIGGIILIGLSSRE